MMTAGWSFAGSATGRDLLQNAGWILTDNPGAGIQPTSVARTACPGDFVRTCAYAVDAQGTPTGETFMYE